ncbi:flagellar biosynthetic protein FliR [Atopococcus tabaci]|uniref:flagellar biosynthetic protein FliR n=1 Tax=Atopococcus tabaci TaxID=269774 RepID=UPI0003FB0457|nr:flagellar biosynthetic protein FliR [Atopococcus tabaci]
MEAIVQQFFIVLMRISLFVVLCPGFSFKGVPQFVKVAISFGITAAVYTTMPPLESVLPTGLFILLLLKEALVGAAIGFIAQLFFTGIEMAGNLVDFQVGFSMASVYDPMMGVQASNYGRVYYWISMCVFFFTNMHHQVIRTLVQSYEFVPVTQTNFTHFGTEGFIHLFGYVFEIALNLAFPLVLVSLLSEVVLALLSRTVPQINVLILGMPLKITVSLLFLFFFLPTLIQNIGDVLPEMIRYINELMRSLVSI